MTELEKVCKYEGAATIDGYVLTISGVQKKFKSSKDAGVFMEAKINDLFDLGIL